MLRECPFIHLISWLEKEREKKDDEIERERGRGETGRVTSTEANRIVIGDSEQVGAT